jgi:hypothetical protein
MVVLKRMSTMILEKSAVSRIDEDNNQEFSHSDLASFDADLGPQRLMLSRSQGKQQD